MNNPWGYIDPGSGVLLVQFLFAALVGSGLYFRKAILRLFHILKKSDRTRKPE